MKRVKRILSMVLVLTLCLGLFALPTNAATADQNTKAKTLWTLGLFKGYDDNGNNFGLSDKATREQALVFLIRLLGEDKAATSWTGATPYTDVPANNWAKSYIGYAKEKGYTVGIGNNKFGFGRNASMQEMTMFVLRGLGYSDASGVKDFTWANCLTVAKSKGILDSDKVITPFTRSIAVEILFGAIGANIKGQDYDLLSKLMNMGVVTQTQYNSAMAIASSTPKDTGTTPTSEPTKPVTAPQEITGTFSIVNNTEKSIVDLYITDSAAPKYDEDFLTKNNYKSFSNSKYINTTFTFDKDTSFDFYIRYADGTESEALGLSFAKATSAGGKITLKSSAIALTSGSATLSTVSLVAKTTKPVTKDVTVTIYNMTGKTWTGLYSSSSQLKDWGGNLSSGNVTDSSSLKVIFPVSSEDNKFDLKAVFSGGEYIFTGLDMSAVTANTSFYLYLNNDTPVISTTKPEAVRNITVNFKNMTDKTISATYSSSSKLNEWGGDLTGSWAKNETVQIIFPVSETDNVFDMKLVIDANEYLIYGLDFSSVTSTITCAFTWENGTPVLYQL